MKLVLDEHFSFKIAEQLRRSGHDVVAVVEVVELRQMSDEDLLRWAHANGRAVVTENVQDFLPIHGQFLNHGEPHCGLILTSSQKFSRSNSGIGALVTALASLLEKHPDGGAFSQDVHWL